MVDHSSLASLAVTLDKGNSSLAKLRASADEGSPLRKVVDLIESLGARLTKLEASAVEMQKTRTIPLRKA